MGEIAFAGWAVRNFSAGSQCRRSAMRYAFLAAIVVSSGSFLLLPSQSGNKIGEPIRLGRPAMATSAPGLHRTSIAFSPDGKKLAWVHVLPEIAPNDGGRLLIHVWDIDK